MAQTSDGPPPQTSHAQSEPTTSTWLRKLPTQLNTPNIFVPDLVQVSPNASDVQQLGRCVPAFTFIRWPEKYNCELTQVQINKPHQTESSLPVFSFLVLFWVSAKRCLQALTLKCLFSYHPLLQFFYSHSAWMLSFSGCIFKPPRLHPT